MLRPVVLALDDDAGRQVRDAHGRIGLVDVLAARARRAKRVDAQVGGIDRDVGDRIGLRQHGDRARRRVDAALRLGLRHALHAMAAGFELELRIRAGADDARDDLACSRRDPTATRRRSRPSSAAARRSARTSGRAPPANSADSSPPVPARISRNTLRSSLGSFGSSIACNSPSSAPIRASAARALLLGVVAHLRVVRELDRRGEIRLRLAELAEARDDGIDLGALARQRPVAVDVARRILGREQARRAPRDARSTGRAWCAAIVSRGAEVGADYGVAAVRARSTGLAAEASTRRRPKQRGSDPARRYGSDPGSDGSEKP